MRPYSRDTVSEGTKGRKRDLGRKGVCRRKEEKGGLQKGRGDSKTAGSELAGALPGHQG